MIWMTPSDVAKTLGVDRRTVSRWAENQLSGNTGQLKLPASRSGESHLYIKSTDLERFIENNGPELKRITRAKKK
jgi:excisionase family DNA binding protein